MTKSEKNDTEPIAKIILSVEIRIRKSKISKKIEKSITQKMDLIRNLKKWSKISSKHFLSRNYQFSTKMVIFDTISERGLDVLVKKDRF